MQQLEVDRDFVDLKRRHDEINELRMTVRKSTVATTCGVAKAAADVDLNKLCGKTVNCPDHFSPKWQRDVENENLKRCPEIRIVNLEQCHDSSLSISDSINPFSAPSVSSATKSQGTVIKSALSVTSETRVKTNFDLLAEIPSDFPYPSTHITEVNVEPELEKGSVEVSKTKFEADDAVAGILSNFPSTSNPLTHFSVADVFPAVPELDKGSFDIPVTKSKDSNSIDYSQLEFPAVESVTEELLQNSCAAEIPPNFPNTGNCNLGVIEHESGTVEAKVWCPEKVNMERCRDWKKAWKFDLPKKSDVLLKHWKRRAAKCIYVLHQMNARHLLSEQESWYTLILFWFLIF